LENGYEVEICDPQAMEANKKPKSVYESPWKGYAFTTSDEVVNFIKEHLDTLKPPPSAEDDYSSAFDQAASEED
jgi:hypothetical protein